MRTLVLQSFLSLDGYSCDLFTDFTRLRLRSSTAFPSGMLELAYAPAGTGR